MLAVIFIKGLSSLEILVIPVTVCHLFLVLCLMLVLFMKSTILIAIATQPVV